MYKRQLEKILPSRKGVLVFCRTRRRVDFVAKALREAGIACDSIHGDRSQSARRQALSDFTEGHVEVLISTESRLGDCTLNGSKPWCTTTFRWSQMGTFTVLVAPDTVGDEALRWLW